MATAEMTRARATLREQASERTLRFVKTYDTATRQLDRVTALGARRMEGILRELRGEIRSRLALLTGGPDDPFSLRIAPAVQREISEALETFTLNANAELSGRLSDAFGLGERVTAQALTSIGIPVAFPSVPPSILATLTGTTQDVLSEMVGSLGQRIMGQVRLAAVGLEPTSAAISRIDDLLQTSEAVRRGLRRRIGFGFQAEAIVRTELGRVYSVAQQAATEQIAETIPDLKKRWVTRRKDRAGHLSVEKDTAPGGRIGPIPVKQRFRVQDTSRIGTSRFLTLGGRVQPPQGPVPGQRVIRTRRTFRRRGRIITDRMLHPRDPGASAGNVVNCTCVVIDFLPEIEAAVERTRGVLQQAAMPEPPAPLKNEFLDRKGRRIERTRNPTTERWKKWSADLNPDEKQAINSFTKSSKSFRALQIGKFTRGPTSKRIAEAELANMQKALDKSPVWGGTTFRGMRDIEPTTFQKWATGDTWEFDSFASTSTKKRIAEEFAGFGRRNQVLLKIRKGSGTWVQPLSAFEEEAEVVYERGQKFRVVKRSLKKKIAFGQRVDRLELELEEIF